MRTAVCTLYEGNYHLGVGALVNSLVANQFKGDVFVGYRGELPPWFKLYQYIHHDTWGEVVLMQLSDYTKVYFVKPTTAIHFTNFKPQFLIDLSKDLCAHYDAIAYFDPDIVVCRSWDYFEDWMQHGVALVHESVTNDMPPTHPLRKKWIKIAEEAGQSIRHQIHSYINGGFCALLINQLSFLNLWQKFIDIGNEKFNAESKSFMTHARPYPFRSLDQDSLNIAAMVYEHEISEAGPEAMGFIHGVVAMAHAVGNRKPWKKRYLMNALLGNSPSYADKAFWKYANGEIVLFPQKELTLKQSSILISSFIGRFYKRN